ncbi:hypothetical protein M9H77_27293 [Catharanthus roseus]|uniref:Uncharacterized protein n=1 Tax=Catharanthus roseus TaxID=4058 RepID=A0ACC0ADQ3_CATRO|nr:hypothetical protein M9H77_27293 [Catharanthus roseus]
MQLPKLIIAPDLHSGLKFGENQVKGRVSGLHCTWLVPRTRASSDDVDEFLTLRVDPLEEGRSTLRAWPNRLTQDGQRYDKPLNLVPRGTQIPYSAAVDLVAELGVFILTCFQQIFPLKVPITIREETDQ